VGTFCPPSTAQVLPQEATVSAGRFSGGGPIITVPAGGGIDVPWFNFNTTSVIYWGPGRNGLDISHNTQNDPYLESLVYGLVHIVGDCQWEDGVYNRDMIVQGGDFQQSLFPFHAEQASNTVYPASALPFDQRDVYVCLNAGVVAGSVANLRMSVTNHDAVAREVTYAQMVAWWFPCGIKPGGTPGNPFQVVFGSGI